MYMDQEAFVQFPYEILRFIFPQSIICDFASQRLVKFLTKRRFQRFNLKQVREDRSKAYKEKKKSHRGTTEGYF